MTAGASVRLTKANTLPQSVPYSPWYCMIPKRPGIKCLVVDHDQGQQIFVPASDQGQHPDRGQNRPGQWHRDLPKHARVTAAVDEGRLKQLLGQFRRKSPAATRPQIPG